MRFDYFIIFMKKLSEELFKELLQKALSNPRKRTHYNLHEDLGDPVQRLCIAMGSRPPKSTL
jgi:cupin fold WbuC family metalloprotein